jgi:translation initiation factor 3 subunit C
VKSAKDRVVDALRECVNRVNNGLKNLDWAIIEDEFAITNKKLEKSKNQLEAGTPKFYVKMLAALEDAVTETIKDKAKLKAMKPAVVRIINRMKLNVKKHNKSFEADIVDYRASPEDYDTAVEDSDSDSDSDSDEDSDEESEEEDLAKKPKVSTHIIFPSLSWICSDDDKTFLVTDTVPSRNGRYICDNTNQEQSYSELYCQPATSFAILTWF